MTTIGIGDERGPGTLARRYHALWLAYVDASNEGGHFADSSELPDVFTFLNSYRSASKEERLAVLLVDLRERWRIGRGRSVESYLAHANDIASDPDLVTELVNAELSARQVRGDVVDLEGFAGRFPPVVRRSLTGQLSAVDLARLVDTRDQDSDEPRTRFVDFKGTLPDPSVELDLSPGTRYESELDSSSGPTRSISGSSDALTFPVRRPIEKLGDSTPFPSNGEPETRVDLRDAVRYAIRRRLGKGGMGVVYEAFDREREEIVALKTMKRVDPLALYRFKHEFRTLADLAHPNLVSLYELIAVGDLWFFTMELVKGLDFISYVRGDVAADEFQDNRWRTRGACDAAYIERACPTIRQLTEAVYALHQAGKLHRDLKPTNVIVTPEGRVVVLDFGLSADLERSGFHRTADDRVVGTVAYMSPEQAASQSLTPASDWYSVGVMLYESLTGRLPFEGPHLSMLVDKQRFEPPPPASIVSGIPDDLNDLCVALLRRSPENRLSGEAVLARLYHEVGTKKTRGSSAGHAGGYLIPRPGGVTPLIGRERHAEILATTFAKVKAGKAVFMLVSGRSGSGKTTLIQTFLDEIARDGEAVVLSGRCYERESLPHKALDSVVDALCRYLKSLPKDEAAALLPEDVALLARMFPVLQRVEVIASAPRVSTSANDKPALSRRAFVALRAILAAISRVKPLVVAIDDLQWGDGENAILLADLLRPPDAGVMLLLVSYRTEEAENSAPVRALLRGRAENGEPLDAFMGDGSDGFPERRELVVDSLTYVEARELALSLLGGKEPICRVEAHLVARESRGNPFFIDELVKFIQEEGGLASRASKVGLIALDEVIWSRVGRLSEEARRLLEVIAVSGRPIGMQEAFQAAELGPEGRSAASALRFSRLVRGTALPNRDAIETYHDWVRETVVAHLEPRVLAGHHARLARVLETSDPPDHEALAVHFEGAGQFERAAGFYAKAADKAVDSLASFHAVKLYRKALALRPSGTDEGEGVRIRSRLGDALANTGRGHEAAREYLAAAEFTTAADALDLRRRAAMQLMMSGQVDEGFKLLQTVLDARGISMPATSTGALISLMTRRLILKLRGLAFQPRDATQVTAEALSLIDLCWSAGAGLSIIDPVHGADFQTRGLLLALKAGEPYRVARAIALEAGTVSLAGRKTEARVTALIQEAERQASPLGSPHLEGLIILVRGIAALMRGRWEEAHAWFSRAEPVLRDRCTGVAWEIDTAQNLMLWALTSLGDLVELRRLFPILLQEARERGDLYAVTTLNTYYMTLLKLADDEPEGALSELDEVIAAWSNRGFHIQHSSALRARVAIALYEGDPRKAWQLVKEAWGKYRKSMLSRIQLIRITITELRARCALALAMETNNRKALHAEVERGIAALEKEGEPWALAHAVMLRAGVAAQRNQQELIVPLLEDAAERYTRVDMRLNASIARRRAGQFLGSERGWVLISESDDLLISMGVKSPTAFAASFAPGFLFEVEETATSDQFADSRSLFIDPKLTRTYESLVARKTRG